MKKALILIGMLTVLAACDPQKNPVLPGVLIGATACAATGACVF